MHSLSKKTFLLIIAITAILLSKVLFLLFADLEGPNLLISLGLAALIFCISLLGCAFNFPTHKKLLAALCIQIVVTVGLYFLMK